uniref:Uncharacterized protein n=1 Tax=Oryza rufipogon TaxID=4529 RepID=A0A0E0QT05_ORYRU
MHRVWTASSPALTPSASRSAPSPRATSCRSWACLSPASGSSPSPTTPPACRAASWRPSSTSCHTWSSSSPSTASSGQWGRSSQRADGDSLSSATPLWPWTFRRLPRRRRATWPPRRRRLESEVGAEAIRSDE